MTNRAFQNSVITDIDDVARDAVAVIRGLQKEVDDLRTALAEVVQISDRKHEAWDRAHKLLISGD